MGFLIGLLTQMMFVGYSIVEAFIFMLAFNYFAPWFSENLYHLPVIHVSYWVCISGFILIHYIGNFIGKLTPKIVKIENKNSESENSK